ncbi:UDP-3-O-acyl-N-acetylglucosamine deacetylase [Heyndrickxia oleronia]|uniref:UDP-3-O-acyl-N-acetylglucosamine deacetylase n=1 Tax=Heyndrickxia oleronia TaxID=38875 RepID=UPI00203CE325|nr:UDP-3-O-acyl-N-acetylglucosamine deacetylase [Heyndrickxia oleronia]MCM3237629.1 UDP-3-O-acyl-N-acetylglucosamine deacetylase [Heyndrickxia oleronia]
MQKTITFQSEVSGVAVNGKSRSKIVFEAAEPNTGIVFIRDDLPDKPEIPCLSEYAVMNKRWSSLVKNGIHVEHTEHVLAAISGLGITNIRIHLNCPSIPVVSTFSSWEFIEALLKAVPIAQSSPLNYHVVKEPLWIMEDFKTSNGKSYDSFLLGLPSDHFSITYFLDYPEEKISTQVAHFSTINDESFISELAKARSFILDNEYEAKVQDFGETINNCLFIPSGNATLQWSNEVARHKVLDLIGDLMFTGQPIKGHFIGFRSGHKMNIKMVRLISSI